MPVPSSSVDSANVHLPTMAGGAAQLPAAELFDAAGLTDVKFRYKMSDTMSQFRGGLSA